MFGKIKPFLLITFLISFTAAAGFGLEDYKTRIAIIPMENNTGDSQYDALCETITDTVGLVLQFLKDYRLFTEDEVPEIAQLRDVDENTLREFGMEEGFDEIIFGTARLREEGGFAFSLSIFNTYEGKVQVEETAAADSIFDVFDAADTITLELIAQVSDIHVGFGSLQLVRGEGYGTYDVYLDDKLIRNYERVFRRVLNGSYVISIRQERLLGDTVIFEESIEVYENKTTTVTFDIPGASEEEFSYLREQADLLFSLAEDPENIEHFLLGIAEFQRKTQRTGYDRRLETKKEEILDQVGIVAVDILEQLKQKGDDLYYRENPDFDDALDVFVKVSRLLNNVFDYTILDEEELEMQLPRRIHIGRESEGHAKGFFILDGEESNLQLRSFEADGKQRSQISFPIGVENFGGDICTDIYGKVYFFSPLETEITVYDGNLNVFTRYPIPSYSPAEGEIMRMTRSEDGTFYIIGTSRVICFNPEGEVLDETEEVKTVVRRTVVEEKIAEVLYENNGFRPSSVFFDKADRLNVYSAETNVCTRFDELGNYHSEIVFPDSRAGSNLSIDSLGYFYLTLPDDSGIAKYSPGGELVTRFGEFGQGPGQFSRPEQCSVADDGTIYVADTYNHRIQILELTSPPVLVPEISRYGIQFKLREKISGNAVETLARTEEQISAGPVIGKLAGGIASWGGAAGLHYLADTLKADYLATYKDYRQAAEADTATDLHSQAEVEWTLSSLSDVGNFTVFGAGTMLLTSGILDFINVLGLRKRTVRNLQSLSLDREYVLDEREYRGLRTSLRIGFLTGTIPVFAGAVTFGLIAGPKGMDVNPLLISAIVLGSVVVPPIWGHLYGGTFHVGLFSAGLAADAMAVAALVMIVAAGPEGHPAFQTSVPAGPVSLESTFGNIGTRLPIYLMVGAMCTRLAAGVWDATHAWVRTHEHNQYHADVNNGTNNTVARSPNTADFEVKLLPLLTIGEGYGMAVRFTF